MTKRLRVCTASNCHQMSKGKIYRKQDIAQVHLNDVNAIVDQSLLKANMRAETTAK